MCIYTYAHTLKMYVCIHYIYIYIYIFSSRCRCFIHVLVFTLVCFYCLFSHPRLTYVSAYNAPAKSRHMSNTRPDGPAALSRRLVLGFRVSGLGFRGLGFRGLGFRVVKACIFKRRSSSLLPFRLTGLQPSLCAAVDGKASRCVAAFCWLQRLLLCQWHRSLSPLRRSGCALRFLRAFGDLKTEAANVVPGRGLGNSASGARA